MRGKRADIQGLRALAVVLVIANHYFGWPAGGYIGVDVFFVVSGFLITGVLLREHDQTGKISLANFYRHRFRRILPAAVAVVAVTVAASWAVFTRGRALSATLDALWAELFGANWRFAAAGTDYLHAAGPISPLQHYWSLSIEEQFYFVWPLALILIFLLIRRHQRRVAVVAIGGIGLLSFVWAIVETAIVPTWAYFSTFSRMWELAAGALLALTASHFRTLAPWMRPALAWTGIATITAGALLLNSSSSFPGPFAIVPVVGTLAVIAAGIGAETKFLWPLTNRVSGYVGDISYSLYLWHFPVFTFASIYLSDTPRRLVAISLMVTGILSVLSFRFIEEPFRRSTWLEARKTVRLLWPGLGVSAVALFVALIVVLPVAIPSTSAQAGKIGPRQESIVSALSATQWPDTLTPPISDVAAGTPEQIQSKSGCLNPPTTDGLDSCTYGKAGSDKIALVVGDSVGMSWIPGIIAAIGDTYEVRGIGFSNCPFADIPIELPASPTDAKRCDRAHAHLADSIKAIRPSLLIISDVEMGFDRAIVSKPTERKARWESAFERSLDAVAADVDEIAVLTPPPMTTGTDSCASAGAGPESCRGTIRAAWRLKAEAEATAAETVGAKFVDTSTWFCNDRVCPAFAGNMIIRIDGMHLTRQYSESLAPELRASLMQH